MDTAQLRQAATAILAFLHPDGTLTPDRVHRADRDVALRRHPDGSGDVRAHLTPACYALWETILEPLARKRPDDGCGPDLRSPGQRRHDALEDAAKRLLRTGELPSTAGVVTTLMITITLHQLETRAGQATTGHGGQISIAEALRLAADGKALPVVLNAAGGILAYGRARRLASPAQRLALMARDKGCTFPAGKPRPAPRCTTSPTGPTAAPPTPTNSPSPATTTTMRLPGRTGTPSCSTASRTGCRRHTSTRSANPNATASTAPNPPKTLLPRIALPTITAFMSQFCRRSRCRGWASPRIVETSPRR